MQTMSSTIFLRHSKKSSGWKLFFSRSSSRFCSSLCCGCAPWQAMKRTDDCPTQRRMLKQALELTCAGINLENMRGFLLGEDETKIINQIAITYSEEGKRRQAIEIYRQLIRYVESHFPDCEVRQVMLPLTAYNYSRLLGLERRYEEAIEVAELGRQCCVKYNKCRMLGGLLLNIACCLHELGEDEKSKELLIQSYYVGLAMENFQDCEVIKRYAKETIGLLLN